MTTVANQTTVSATQEKAASNTGGNTGPLSFLPSGLSSTPKATTTTTAPPRSSGSSVAPKPNIGGSATTAAPKAPGQQPVPLKTNLPTPRFNRPQIEQKQQQPQQGAGEKKEPSSVQPQPASASSTQTSTATAAATETPNAADNTTTKSVAATSKPLPLNPAISKSTPNNSANVVKTMQTSASMAEPGTSFDLGRELSKAVTAETRKIVAGGSADNTIQKDTCIRFINSVLHQEGVIGETEGILPVSALQATPNCLKLTGNVKFVNSREEEIVEKLKGLSSKYPNCITEFECLVHDLASQDEEVKTKKAVRCVFQLNVDQVTTKMNQDNTESKRIDEEIKKRKEETERLREQVKALQEKLKATEQENETLKKELKVEKETSQRSQKQLESTVKECHEKVEKAEKDAKEARSVLEAAEAQLKLKRTKEESEEAEKAKAKAQKEAEEKAKQKKAQEETEKKKKQQQQQQEEEEKAKTKKLREEEAEREKAKKLKEEEENKKKKEEEERKKAEKVVQESKESSSDEAEKENSEPVLSISVADQKDETGYERMENCKPSDFAKKFMDDMAQMRKKSTNQISAVVDCIKKYKNKRSEEGYGMISCLILADVKTFTHNILKTFLDKAKTHVNVNELSHDLTTPLFHSLDKAIFFDKKAVSDKPVTDKKASKELTNTEKATKYFSMVEFLVGNGANTLLRDHNNCDFISYAAKTNETTVEEVEAVLKKRCPSVVVKDEEELKDTKKKGKAPKSEKASNEFDGAMNELRESKKKETTPAKQQPAKKQPLVGMDVIMAISQDEADGGDNDDSEKEKEHKKNVDQIKKQIESKKKTAQKRKSEEISKEEPEEESKASASSAKKQEEKSESLAPAEKKQKVADSVVSGMRKSIYAFLLSHCNPTTGDPKLIKNIDLNKQGTDGFKAYMTTLLKKIGKEISKEYPALMNTSEYTVKKILSLKKKWQTEGKYKPSETVIKFAEGIEKYMEANASGKGKKEDRGKLLMSFHQGIVVELAPYSASVMRDIAFMLNEIQEKYSDKLSGLKKEDWAGMIPGLEVYLKKEGCE